MAPMDDMALLRDYSQGQSESAFATLVSRHILTTPVNQKTRFTPVEVEDLTK